MLANLSNWLDERFGWRNVWETIFKRKIPKVNWAYTLGSATCQFHYSTRVNDYFFAPVNAVVTPNPI